MPTENENLDLVIGDDGRNTEPNTLDVAEFANNTVREGYTMVTIQTQDDGPVTIEVDSYLVGDDGFIKIDELAQDDIEDICRRHGVCWMNHDFTTAGWYKISIDRLNYSMVYSSYILSDDSIYGYTDEGEDYFHLDEDYVVCNDERYISSEVANDYDVYWCDGCDEYRRSDEHDFEECENGDSSNHWDNTRHYYPKTLDAYKKWGVNSPTYTISNGIENSFGVEIETIRGNIYEYSDLNCKSVYDGSVSGNEYVTGVLKGDYGFNHLKKICDRINDESHEINSTCGIHVHIGGTFNRRFTIMLLKLCYQIQEDIWIMLPPSRTSNSFCKLIPTWASEISFQNFREKLGRYIYGSADDKLDRHRNKKCRHDHYASTRYRWVNINNFSTNSGKPTVEFRCHGASTNYEKIRNWTLMCMAIVRYAESNQRRIYSDVSTITLKEVIMSSLGDNIGKQIYDYYLKRCRKFDVFYNSDGSHYRRLPSTIVNNDGTIE